MIRYLYHISDIHIRLYHRLEEYQVVFDNLYRFLESEKRQGSQGLIVITGDLLHHKNELSPECIVFTRSFMLKLSSYFRVVLIAGNHDALLNNQHRMDSISAVLEPCPTSVLYLKKSGFYEVENVIFGVSSLLDKTMLPFDENYKKEGKTIVALYHGGVGKFSTNKGFQMEGIPLSTFEGYDLVLLGDIHLHQYLDAKKKIAYAGSLISQNFTETDSKHGVLIWDLETKSSKLQKIENPFAFCEGILEYPYFSFEGCRYEKSQLSSLLPPKGRLNLVLNRKKTVDDISWIRELHDDYPHLTIQEKPVLEIKPNFKPQSNAMETSSPKLETNEISLLESYLKTLPQEWEDVERIFKELKEACLSTTGEYKTGVRWELEDMEFSNMFGFGPDNKLSFKSLPPQETIGIFGQNSAGKSSLIEILVFLLYGNITRYAHGASVPKEVIRFGQTKSSGRITFKVNGILYKIEKQMTLQKSGKIRVEEKLWKIEEGQKIDLSEEHRKKTDKFVMSQIGTCDQFLFTTVFLQQNERSFRGLSPRERKDFLFQLLDLQRFETLWTQKSEELRFLKKELDGLEKQQKKLVFTEIENNYQKSKRNLILLKQEKQELDKQLQELEKERNLLLEQKEPIPYSSVEKRRREIETELKEDLDYTLDENCPYDREEVMQTISHLCTSKLPEPIKPRDDVPSINLPWFDKESFTTWNNENPPLEKPCIQNLFRAKEEWVEKLLPETNNPFVKWTSKQCKTKIQQIQPLSSLESIEKSMSIIQNELEKLDKEMEIKETEIEKEKQIITSYLARQDQTSQVVKKLIFASGCSSCQQNKTCFSKTLHLETKIQSVQQKLENLQKELFPKQQKYDELKQKELTFEEQKKAWEDISKLQTVVYNKSIRKKIQVLEEKIQVVVEETKEAELRETIRRIWKEFLNWNDVIQSNKKVDQELENWKHKLRAIETWEMKKKESLKRQESVEKLKIEYEQLEIWERKEKVNVGLQKKLEGLVKEIHQVQSRLRLIVSEIFEEESNVRKGKEEIERALEIQQQYTHKKKELEFIQHLVHVIGRDGFPMFLLDKMIPSVEDHLNELLFPFFQEKKVSLKLEKKKDSIQINLCICRGEHETVYLGGMEGFMVDAALKIVFARISKFPRSDLFIIDEGISALDQKNMENLDQLFQFLESYFHHVFIISHIKQVQDFVRHSLLVTKENGESRLNTFSYNGNDGQKNK